MSETREEAAEETAIMVQEPMYRNPQEGVNFIEEELPPEAQSFVTRLNLWLQAQPEWLAMMAGTRQQRKETARRLAVHVFTFQEGTQGPGRAAFRKQVKKLRAENIAPRLTAHKRRREQDDARFKKVQARYARLSDRRLEELAYQENLAHDARVAQAVLEDDAPDVALD